MFKKFLSYSPYLTFSDLNNDCLITHNGEKIPNTESLYILGREAYNYFIDGIESEEHFNKIVAGFIETIITFREILPKKTYNLLILKAMNLHSILARLKTVR